MPDTVLVQDIPSKALREEPPSSVWVLVIDRRHGTYVTAHSSRAAVEAKLHTYCDEHWDREFGADTRPAPDKLVSSYWDRMSAYGEEWYFVEECVMSGPACETCRDTGEIDESHSGTPQSGGVPCPNCTPWKAQHLRDHS